MGEEQGVSGGMTRRRALGWMGAVGLGALGLWPEPAEAGVKSRVVSVDRGKMGTTVVMELANAPYPCPGRSYTDATTIAYIPHHYRLPGDKKIDMVVHFHGHNTNARQAMYDHQLREQFVESKQNAILIIPQGPLNARDGNGGKLGLPDGLLNFLTDVRQTLQLREVSSKLRAASLGNRAARVGHVALSAHSGGYHVAAQCLRHGGFEVKEVYLFDALYGDADAFKDWVVDARRKNGRDRHKLICYYTGGRVQAQSRRLMDMLQQNGVEVLHEEREGQLTRAQLTEGRAIFINTSVGHGRVTSQYNALRDCLFASGFKRRLKSAWFRNADQKRDLEKRD